MSEHPNIASFLKVRQLDRWIDDATSRGITIIRLYITRDLYGCLDRLKLRVDIDDEIRYRGFPIFIRENDK